MKKIFTMIAAVLLTASVFSQFPQMISYQAVVRDVNQVLVTNQLIGMQISILQGSPNGTLVYIETQSPTTNINGLISTQIGGSPEFVLIDWTDGPYFIQTELDPNGGTNYSITSTTQLMSVPYALHANTAENVTGVIEEL